GGGVISAQEYEQVRTALEVARARRDQLRIQLERAAIRSPLDGSVAARLIDAGSYVKQGTVVFRLVQDDPLKFRGDVPERDVPILAAGQDVRITVDAFPGETFVGHVSRIGAASDPAVRSLAFEALVPNEDHRLRPGFFGHGEVVVRRDDRALAVFGLFSYRSLGLDLFPNIDFPIVTVTTTLKGASVEEMETGVTKVLEEAVNTIDGIDELRSITKEGLSTIVVQFVLEKSRDTAAQDVRDKVATVLAQLPGGT